MMIHRNILMVTILERLITLFSFDLDSPSTLRQRHDPSKDETNNSDNDNNDEEVSTNTPKKARKNSDNDDDRFLERFQQQQRKRETLETKAKISHRVFCPFFPEVNV